MMLSLEELFIKLAKKILTQPRATQCIFTTLWHYISACQSKQLLINFINVFKQLNCIY